MNKLLLPLSSKALFQGYERKYLNLSILLQKLFRKKLLLWIFLCSVFISLPISAQFSSISTYPTISSTGGVLGGVTFEVNTVDYLQLIRMQVALASSGDSLPLDIYYRPGGVNPGRLGPTITPAAGWIHWGTTYIDVDSRYVPIPTPDINLHLKPGRYGFFVISPGQYINTYRWSSPVNPTQYTSGAVTLSTDTSIGYAGTLPNPTLDKNRMFIGGIDFYSYTHDANDIMVLSIDSPAYRCAGLNNVAVTLRNYGSTQIQSVQINWKVDNVLQTPFNYTNILDTIGGTGNFEAQTVIGSFNSVTGQAAEIEVWTSMPNGNTDPNSFNDSAAIVFTPAMSGIYTIDPNGAGTTNFRSFSEAVNTITIQGVCGPVVFNIAAGVYNEQISIDEIPGTSTTNTVTFQPDVNSTGAVEMKYATSHNDSNYVVKFNGCSYVIIDGISMTNNGANHTTSILYEDGSHHNTVQNCSLFGPATPPSTGDAFAVVYCENSPGIEHNTIANNYIYGGSYGIQYRGITSSDRLTNVLISGNTIEEPYRYGIYVYEVDSAEIENNLLVSSSAYTGTSYAIYVRYGKGIRIFGNKVKSPGVHWPAYALYCRNIEGNNTRHAVIANNLLNAGDPSAVSDIIGIYTHDCSYLNIVHNNVAIESPSVSSSAAELVGSGFGSSVYNNNFINYGAGYALKMDSSGYLSAYNNLFTNGLLLCNFSGGRGDVADLAEWQETGNGLHSFNLDPLFPALDSLYTQVAELDNRGIPFPDVSFDINGNPRSTVAVDVGANEFSFIKGECSPITEYRIDSVTNSGFKIDWRPGSGNTSFYIEYGTTGFNPGSGTLITGTYPSAQPPVYIGSLAGKTEYDIYFGELCNSGGDSSYLAGKWTVKTFPICPPVWKVVLDSISSDSAVFTLQYAFSDIIDISDFDYEYGLHGFAQGMGTKGSFGNPGRIGDLAPSTEYDIYVRGNCDTKGNGTTNWYGPYSFQTNPLCSPVEDIHLEYISPDSAVFSFSVLYETDSLDYEYGPQGFKQGTGAGGTFSNPGGLGDLVPLTYYDIYVRSNCKKEGKGTSIWIGPFPFYTACPASMSGTYTVNPSQPLGNRNFKNFKQLISDLKNCGISGPVTVNVSQGLYLEQVLLDSIPGISAENTLTIQADPANTTSVEIKYAATGAHEDYVLRIDALSHVTLRELTFIMEKGAFSGSTTVVDVKGECSNLSLERNRISGGSYGIRLSSSVTMSNSRIDSNYIEEYMYAGVYASYQDSLFIRGNVLGTEAKVPIGSVLYGIFIESINYTRVTGNKVFLSGSDVTHYGMRFHYVQADVSTNDPAIIANNMISVSNSRGISYGLFANSCSYIDLVYNSIFLSGSPVIGYGLRIGGIPITGTGIQVINNSVVNASIGTAIEVDNQSVNGNAVSAMNRNNYFARGPEIGRWGEISAFDLTGWKTLSGMDQNSVSGNPLYSSAEDLHAASPLLHAAGTPYSSIITDIDGETRSPTNPNIGADEFTPDACYPSYNLKALNIYHDQVELSWISGAGTTRVLEYGPHGYTAGMGTRIISITGSAHTLRGLAPQTTYDIYIRDNCGTGDSSLWFGPLTVQTRCVNQLSGSYTIDNSQPTAGTNYTSFGEAAADLKDCGVSGPVVFNIREGNYNDSLLLVDIEGSSALNTITFQPDPANTQPVILHKTSKSAINNYVVQFNNASYVSIKGLTISASDTNYGRVVNFKGKNSYIAIEDNILNGASVDIGNSDDVAVVVYDNDLFMSNDLHHSLIRNNRIYNGSRGVYLFGGSNSNRGKRNIIEGNIIEGFVSEAIYTRYQDSLVVKGNTITSGPHGSDYGIYTYVISNSVIRNNMIHDVNTGMYLFGINNNNRGKRNVIEGNAIEGFDIDGMNIWFQDSLLIKDNRITSGSPNTAYGIDANYIGHSHIIGNKIVVKGIVNNYGIYLSNWSGNSGSSCLISNNMVSTLNNHLGFTYGLYLSNPAHMDVVHNSILVNAGSQAEGYVCYLFEGSNIKFLNNSFINTGPGFAMGVYASAIVSISEMDYNNFYAAGSNLGNWGGTDASDLAAWQTLSGKDANSVSGDPFYKAPDNLHFSGINSVLNGAGTPYPGITTDIDGDLRSATAPDIGADEGPDCELSTSLSIDSIRCYNAYLSWTPGLSGAFAHVEYDTAGFAVGTGQVVFNDSSLILHGLDANTTYEVYLSDTCGPDTVAALGPISFTTLPDTTVADFSFVARPATLTDQAVDFDASSSTGAITYQWNFGDGNSGNGMMTSHSYTANGTYIVELIVTGDCSSDTLVQTIVISGISLEENIISRSLEIFPNPTEDRIQIRFETQSSEEVVIRLSDLSGKMIWENRATDVNGRYEGEISLEHLAQGTYMLQIRSSGMEAAKRIVKQ